MRIEHIAIWTTDIEKLKGFYSRFFGASAGDKYHNPTKGFSSYFLSFEDGCRLEIMQKDDIQTRKGDADSQLLGLAHFAISLSDKQAVDEKAKALIDSGVALLDGPRLTGDGYYEAVVLDPDGNRIEIMAQP